MVKRNLFSETGQSATEYSLLIIFIAAFIVGTLRLTGVTLPELYRKAICAFQDSDICSEDYLVYSDYFDGDLSGWTIGVWGNPKRQWWLEGGRLLGERNAGILFDDFDGEDFSIYIDDLKLTNKAKVWQGITVHFRTDNQDGDLTGYSFHQCHSHDQKA